MLIAIVKYSSSSFLLEYIGKSMRLKHVCDLRTHHETMHGSMMVGKELAKGTKGGGGALLNHTIKVQRAGGLLSSRGRSLP